MPQNSLYSNSFFNIYAGQQTGVGKWDRNLNIVIHLQTSISPDLCKGNTAETNQEGCKGTSVPIFLWPNCAVKTSKPCKMYILKPALENFAGQRTKAD